MSLTQTIISSLQKNLVNGAGFYRSPNGVFEATWLPDERTCLLYTSPSPRD